MLAEQSIDLLHESALHKKLTISNQINHDAVVRADNDQLDIVIRNLLANAIKFTPEHGTVTIGSSEQGDRIILSVRDTGIGMNQETIGKLFDHKQHFTSEGTGGERGTGLGLLICKEFVNKNGGNIVVESEEGKGSCFSFDLPKAG
jgi:signal transduction histidine kinase